MADQNGYWGIPLELETLRQIQVRGEVQANEHKSPEQLRYLTSNAPWILFRSGVDIDSVDSTIGGSALAKQYVLSGGTLSATGNDFDSRAGINFTRERNNTGAYQPTGGNGRYDFGLRPMPGITSIKVSPKDEWGFIVSAEINISVWSVDDLEAMNKLYFRPGFAALLEWGHSIYLDNEGNVREMGINNSDTVSPISNNDWFNPSFIPYTNGRDFLGYYEEIIRKQRTKSCGNYDGICGYITNFSYNLEKNGEWKCTVSMVSRGAKTLSAGIGISGTSNRESSDKDIKGNTIFNRIYKKLIIDSVKPGTKNIIDNVEIEDKTPNSLVSRPSSAQFSAYSFSRERIAVYYISYSAFTKDLDKNGITVKDDFPVLMLAPSSSALYYIRLFDILNLLYSDQRGFNLDFVDLKQGFDLKTGYRYAGFDRLLESIGDRVKNPFFSINPFEVLLPPVEPLTIPNLKENAYEYFTDRPKIDNQYVIGNTFINIESIVHIISQCVQESGENECSVGAFLSNIFRMIEKDLGGIPDLGLWEDIEYPGVIAVVDRNRYTEFQDLQRIPLTGLRSTVESLQITSEITDNMVNMMSVAAQAPAGNSLPSSLIHWNDGLKNRFVTEQSSQTGPNTGSLVNNVTVDEDVDKTFLTLYEKFWKGDADEDLEQKFTAQTDIISKLYAEEFKDDIRGVIPVKVSFTTKGISKFYIGLYFGVEPGLLPKEYDNWGYIVTGVEHNVSSNGWKTTVNTQYCPPGKI